MNIQFPVGPHGGLIWASPAFSGSTRGLAAAGTHGIIDALTSRDRRAEHRRAQELTHPAKVRSSPNRMTAIVQAALPLGPRVDEVGISSVRRAVIVNRKTEPSPLTPLDQGKLC
ncbi:hypothetical protein [Actinomadura formosensis]|uniref:hypothetical protein n=1 Tax=Actinomadura formosensis TaxID=60706 RepID=UPI000AF84B82|nr:hypothetical protein [Actinomadura formosensis]